MKHRAPALFVLVIAVLLVAAPPLATSSAVPRPVGEPAVMANRYPVSLNDPRTMDTIGGFWSDDADAYDNFGRCVAMYGDRIVVGAPGENNGAGAVYIFERDGVTLTQVAKLVSPDPGQYEFFGCSVSTSGGYLAVGEYRDAAGGAVHIFTESAGAWEYRTKIEPDDGVLNDAFGYSVDLYGGSTLAVGAYYGNGSGGRAYVYTGSLANWSKQGEFTAEATADDFGWSVAVDHDTLVVGAPRNDSPAFDAGTAYVYTRSGGVWSPQQELVASDQASSDYFAADVDVVDDTVLVGSYFDDDLGNISGAVYEFERTGTVWTEDEKLTPDDGDEQDQFGYSVALDGMTAIIGAPGTGSSGSNTGSAYIFTRSAGDWSQLKRVDADDPNGDAYFGADVAVQGSLALVGARENDVVAEASGEAYLLSSYYFATEDEVLTVDAPGVLANDYDLDGDAFTMYGLVADAQNGSVEFAADGSFVYTPDPGFKGYDWFTYYNWDGEDYSDTTRVDLYVRAVHDYVSIAGDTRFETGAQAALSAFPEGADTIVLATGRNFPDALGGSALAGALDAPLLLVDTASVPTEVLSAIVELDPSHVIILGGESAVPDDVRTPILATMGAGATIERIAGTNRYDTARLVAARTVTELGGEYSGGAFVATGLNFPDALAAGPVAASSGWPIYLVANTTADTATFQAMEDDGASTVRVVGGEGVVKPSTFTALEDLFGDDAVDRLAGDNRYETAVAVSEMGVNDEGMQWDGVGIATGVAFPDALAAGAMLGSRDSVLLLSRPDVLSPETQTALQLHGYYVDDVHFFGGLAALSQSVRTSVQQILED